MTRETKIGLLVGLAFIIVIGILLSDYNRNETQTAALPLVADNVKNSTATLRNGSNQSEVVPPPAPATPARTVPTRDDLHIDIGPGGPGPVTNNPGNDRHVIQPATPTAVDNTPANPLPEAPVNPAPGESGNPPIRDTVTYDPHPPIAPLPQPAPPTQTVNGARAYVAVESDTVSKLAGRFLGGNTKSNREAIIAINPTLKANPNNVIVGRTYMIPPARTATATVSAPTPPISPIAAAPTPAPVANDGPHYFYTVKENDNLWKIAATQLGDGTAWAAIKELNKDVLKGRDDVRPNMRLRLPAKPVASVN